MCRLHVPCTCASEPACSLPMAAALTVCQCLAEFLQYLAAWLLEMLLPAPSHSSHPCCLQSVNLAADDPTNSYMLSAGARICKCLGQEFLPYLSIVMPPLLHSAQLKPDVEVKGSSEDSDEEEDDDEVGPCLTVGSPPCIV